MEPINIIVVLLYEMDFKTIGELLFIPEANQILRDFNLGGVGILHFISLWAHNIPPFLFH